MRAVMLVAAALSLAGCMGSPSQVDSTTPTVTYKYFGDTYGSQFDEVAARADGYCSQEFNKTARLRNVDEGGDEHFATFECV
jgi:hypothetical protein